MKAVNYPAAGQVVLSDMPDPTPGPGEAVIAVKASGLCHTDIDVLHARYGPGAFPVVPGHEYAGEVVSIGADVQGLSIGDRVAVDPNLSCGTCRSCRAGMANLCDTLGAYGVTRNGGFAQYSVVRAGNLVPIGDMPYDMAALAEPMGCVLNCLSAVTLKPEQNALIFGAGPMGLLIGMGMQTQGLSRITFADVDPLRLELAESFGFSSAAVGSPELAAMEQGIDVTVDATGRASVAAGLVGYTANGGSCLYFGVCAPDAKIEISPFEVFRRQLTIAGTHSLNHNIPEALAAIRAFGPDISRLVSHRMSLEEIAATLTTHPPAGSLKIQVSGE